MQKNIHHYYSLHEKIGKGGFASVYLVQNKADNKFYAAKVFLKQRQTKDNLKSIKKEFATISLLNHQNLLNFKEGFMTENTIYLITDYCSGPTLEVYLKQNDYQLSKQQIRKLMKQQLEGVQQLHQLGIMHRDLKPANILFSSNDCQKIIIADFGLAQRIQTEKYLFPRAGTPGYLAPEIANNTEKLSNYSEMCDMFSLGCILYLMATGKKLFEGKQIQEILSANKLCQIDFANDQFNKIDLEIKEVLIALLAKNPSDRLSAKEILNLKFFNKKQTLKLSENENQVLETTFSKTISLESLEKMSQRSENNFFFQEIIKK